MKGTWFELCACCNGVAMWHSGLLCGVLVSIEMEGGWAGIWRKPFDISQSSFTFTCLIYCCSTSDSVHKRGPESLEERLDTCLQRAMIWIPCVHKQFTSGVFSGSNMPYVPLLKNVNFQFIFLFHLGVKDVYYLVLSPFFPLRILFFFFFSLFLSFTTDFLFF